MPNPRYCEFFAGGGMARIGLGSTWKCVFANDCSKLKVRVYESNFGKRSIIRDYVEKLSPSSIPQVEMIWASFPCQDLSLAGPRGGIHERRSGAFWSFWKVITAAHQNGTSLAPIIVLENVVGLLSSGDGQDFSKVVNSLRSSGYKVGGLIIDASKFLPHSRKRLFIIAIRNEYAGDLPLAADKPSALWHPSVLRKAVGRLLPDDREDWVWWSPRTPKSKVPTLASQLDSDESVTWDSTYTTEKILGSMSDFQRKRLREMASQDKQWVGTLVMRMRYLKDGVAVQRAEVRFDGLANCLRTPGGGSSIQRIITVNQEQTRTRKLSVRESSRLMGLPHRYKLPQKSTDAYQVLGDGLAVPVVRFLNSSLLRPLVKHVLGCGWTMSETPAEKDRVRT